MPARTRSRSTRLVGALAAALTATAVLSACGSDDSTATSTPSTTTTAETSTETSTSAATETSAETTGKNTDGVETGDETTGAAPAPSSPAAAPDGGTAPAPDAAGEAFLAALREKGVEPTDDAGAVNIADYICSAQAQGGSPEEIKVFVTALVGSEAAGASTEVSEEQAAATADTYIAVADETYCN